MFIEVTGKHSKLTINVSSINYFEEYVDNITNSIININDVSIRCKETYKEIKELIRKAYEG